MRISWVFAKAEEKMPGFDYGLACSYVATNEVNNT